MTRRKKIITSKISLSGLLLVLVVFVGSVFVSAEKINITFMRWNLVEANRNLQNQIIAKFEREHPGIKVIVESYPFKNYADKSLTAVAAGSPPDVLYIYDVMAGRYLGMNILEPLDQFMKRDNVSLDAYTQGSRVVYKGKCYLLPFRGGPRALYYNVDYYKEAGIASPPKTWEELRDYAIKLTIDKNGRHPGESGYNPEKVIHYGMGLAASSQGEGMWEWFSIFYSYQGKFLNEDKTAAFNDERGIASLKFLVDLYRKYHVIPPGVTSTFKGDEVKQFTTGLTAMTSYGPWFISWIRDAKVKFDWNVAPLPLHNGHDGEGTGFVWLGIPKSSNHIEEAWEFVKYMTSEEVDYIWATHTGMTPNHIANLNKPFYKTHPKYAVFCKIAPLPGVRNIPFIPEWPKLQDLLLTAYQNALDGKATPKEALDRAAKKWNEYIRKKK